MESFNPDSVFPNYTIVKLRLQCQPLVVSLMFLKNYLIKQLNVFSHIWYYIL
jgi:hypothetical protein